LTVIAPRRIGGVTGPPKPGAAPNSHSPNSPESIIAQCGFEDSESLIWRPRLTICSMGREKTGKTRFTLSAPGPIAIFNFDRPLEPEVLQIAQTMGKKVYHKNYIAGLNSGTQEDWRRLWNQFKSDWEKLCGVCRTVVQDTGTGAWELCRLANFGRVDKIMPHKYGPVNNEFEQVIKLPFKTSGLNSILTHRYKKEYKGTGAVKKPAGSDDDKEVWTGKYERQGFGGAAYEMQICLEHFRSSVIAGDDGVNRQASGEEQYGIRIMESGLEGATTVGMELRGADCNFQYLGLMAVPSSGPEDWE